MQGLDFLIPSSLTRQFRAPENLDADKLPGCCEPLLGKLSTQRPQSSSFLGLPYRILYMNPKKELVWGLWVDPRTPKSDNALHPTI